MKCEELSRLFLAGAPPEEAAAHRRGCGDCDALARQLELLADRLAELRHPEPAPALMAALASLPQRTVSCERADELLALEVEGELPDAEKARLEFHRSRCDACRQTAETMGLVETLVAPEPRPGILTRASAVRGPRPREPWWRFLAAPRNLVFGAYAAAIAMLIIGGEPTSLLRRAPGLRMGEEVAGRTTAGTEALADRLGRLEEGALRAAAIARGTLLGYGRAAASTAGSALKEIQCAILKRSDCEDRAREKARPRST